jgi:hypothetical protein
MQIEQNLETIKTTENVDNVKFTDRGRFNIINDAYNTSSTTEIKQSFLDKISGETRSMDERIAALSKKKESVEQSLEYLKGSGDSLPDTHALNYHREFRIFNGKCAELIKLWREKGSDPAMEAKLEQLVGENGKFVNQVAEQDLFLANRHKNVKNAIEESQQVAWQTYERLAKKFEGTTDPDQQMAVQYDKELAGWMKEYQIPEPQDGKFSPEAVHDSVLKDQTLLQHNICENYLKTQEPKKDERSYMQIIMNSAKRYFGYSGGEKLETIKASDQIEGGENEWVMVEGRNWKEIGRQSAQEIAEALQEFLKEPLPEKSQEAHEALRVPVGQIEYALSQRTDLKQEDRTLIEGLLNEVTEKLIKHEHENKDIQEIVKDAVKNRPLQIETISELLTADLPLGGGLEQANCRDARKFGKELQEYKRPEGDQPSEQDLKDRRQREKTLVQFNELHALLSQDSELRIQMLVKYYDNHRDLYNKDPKKAAELARSLDHSFDFSEKHDGSGDFFQRQTKAYKERENQFKELNDLFNG